MSSLVAPSTAEHLRSYYPFADETLQTVDAVAQQQREFAAQGGNYMDLLVAKAGMGALQSYEAEGYLPIRYVRFVPGEYDKTLVVHLPHANALGPNQLFQVGTLAMTLPDTQIIATGNPSLKPHDYAKLTAYQRKLVAKGDLTPTVIPSVRLVEKELKINETQHAGCSYGAEKAPVAVAHSSRLVSHLVVIEPVSTRARTVLGLGARFARSNGPLEGYVHASQQELYEDARRADGSMLGYIASLGLASNIAISRGLARNRTERRLSAALRAQRDVKATVAWGTTSELADNIQMGAIVRKLAGQFGDNRLRGLSLHGQRHAFPSDIYLQAAVIYQALNDLPPTLKSNCHQG